MSFDSLLGRPLRVVNVGLEVFTTELQAEGAAVVHVEWRPPAGGPAMAALLARLDDES